MNMKKILVSLCVLVLATSLQANAFDWISALKFWENASETQAAQVQTTKSLEDIEKQMSNIDKSVQDAFINIVSELSTRKETKNIKSQLSSSSANLVNVINNYANTLANNKATYENTIKKLSAKEKTTLVNNLAVLSEDAQQYMLLATEGVRTATNTLKASQKLSDFATSISNINKIATDLKGRASTVVNVANQLKNIATAAGVSVK